MSLFNKKQKEVEKESSYSSLEEMPKLPELPRMKNLPSLPEKKPTSKLPSYPSDSLGKQFSQNSIKEAVTGRKEVDWGLDEDDFASNEDYEDTQMIHQPSGSGMKKYSRDMNSQEPVFIRIDKFEDSLKAFEKTKKQISEIESMLRDIKQIQEDEEKELSHWEKEIMLIKSQIEKIDREVFSRLE